MEREVVERLLNGDAPPLTIRRDIGRADDQQIVEIYVGSGYVMGASDPTDPRGAQTQANMAEVRTVTLAVSRRRTVVPDGHLQIPDHMRETPKKQAGWFGRLVSRRRRGIQ